MPRRSAASSEFNIRRIESLGRLLGPRLASSRVVHSWFETGGPGHFASNILHPGRIEKKREKEKPIRVSPIRGKRTRFHFAQALWTSGSNIKRRILSRHQLTDKNWESCREREAEIIFHYVSRLLRTIYPNKKFVAWINRI